MTQKDASFVATTELMKFQQANPDRADRIKVRLKESDKRYIIVMPVLRDGVEKMKILASIYYK